MYLSRALSALLAASALTACATSAAAPSPTSTPSRTPPVPLSTAAPPLTDAQIARRGLLRRGDFPAGWRANDSTAAHIKCKSTDAARRATSAFARGKTFATGENTEAESAAYVYRSVKAAKRQLNRLGGTDTTNCILRAVKRAFVEGAGYTVGTIATAPMQLEEVGDERSGTRIIHPRQPPGRRRRRDHRRGRRPRRPHVRARAVRRRRPAVRRGVPREADGHAGPPPAGALSRQLAARGRGRPRRQAEHLPRRRAAPAHVEAHDLADHVRARDAQLEHRAGAQMPAPQHTVRVGAGGLRHLHRPALARAAMPATPQLDRGPRRHVADRQPVVLRPTAARRPVEAHAGLDPLRRRRRRRLRERRARMVHPLGLAELGLVAVGGGGTPPPGPDERGCAARGGGARGGPPLLLVGPAPPVEVLWR